MNRRRRHGLLMIASFPDSVIAFRGLFMQAAIDAGEAVSLVLPSGDVSPALSAKLESMGVRLYQVPMQRVGTNPIADAWLTWKLLLLLLSIRPAFVLGYTAKPVIYGSLAAWLARIPRRFALITGLGYAFTGRGGLLTRLVRRLYSFSLRKVDAVFFQNPDDRRLFLEQGIMRADARSMVVNGSGVDTVHYCPQPLPDGPVSFLLVARLLGDKGIREYADAAARVKAICPETVFRLAGWMDANPDCIEERELRGWVDQGVIDYLGRLEDVRPAMRDSSVYVLPSYREGTPRSVLEAMAMGRAIITTDAPGCRETVVDGVNGYLVPVRSVDALVAAMLQFVRFPRLLDEMGKMSRAIAEEKYDVRKVNDMLLRAMGIGSFPGRAAK